VSSSTLSRYRVLVVDDEPAVLHLITRSLEMGGFTVVPFSSGRAALDALLGGELFDAVVTDVRMPDVDGRAIAQAAVTLPHMPAILMVTAHDDPLDIPAVPIVRKPFRVDVLIDTVRGLVTSRASAAISAQAQRRSS
jgi:CheY-like chemotaxis protein